MRILIVESNPDLGDIWRRVLLRGGADVSLAVDPDDAERLIQNVTFDAIILDVVLENGSALALADLASYRQPECKIVFVTNSTFFSDGTIFNLCANAAAFLAKSTPPEDLAAMVEHVSMVRRP